MTVIEQDDRIELEPQLSPLAMIQAKGPRRTFMALLGPAFVAAVAYIDPGNFATNFSAGAQFGYLLVWVIVTCWCGSSWPQT